MRRVLDKGRLTLTDVPPIECDLKSRVPPKTFVRRFMLRNHKALLRELVRNPDVDSMESGRVAGLFETVQPPICAAPNQVVSVFDNNIDGRRRAIVRIGGHNGEHRCKRDTIIVAGDPAGVRSRALRHDRQGARSAPEPRAAPIRHR